MIDLKLGQLLQADETPPAYDAARLAPERIRRLANRRLVRRRTVAVSVTALALAGLAGVIGPHATRSTARVTAASAPVPAAPIARGPLALSQVDWINRSYPVPCGSAGPLASTDGVAHPRGVHDTLQLLRVDLVDRWAPAAPPTPAEVVWVTCGGADSFPDSVLVYTTNATGPILHGAAVTYAAGTLVQAVTANHGTLHIRAGGFSTPNVPRFAPDLVITTDAQLAGSGLVVHTSTNHR
jgi:hypothetical protein